MATDGTVVVVGLGEVGKPLLSILSKVYNCVGVDVAPVNPVGPCSVLHVCYPYEIPDFIGTTTEYMAKYRPRLTIVHSTVGPGTTRKVIETTPGASIAYSPVRGKHARMEVDMLRYKKFVGASRPEVAKFAVEHLEQAGFKTALFRTSEIGELSKLLETTYLGLLVAWTQEVERFAMRYGASSEEVNAFIEEIDFLPSHIFPGHIGGHCVMSNIAILRSQFDSRFLDAIVESNELKRRQLLQAVAS